ncbi:FAS-associated death domain protein-like [Branchiostoma floridae x Branchiostoma japonicum]
MDNYFHVVVGNARDKWKEIGRRLGLSETDISAIDEEERGDTTEGCRKVLNKWRQMNGRNATVDVLKQAFIELERRDVVDLLEHEYVGN